MPLTPLTHRGPPRRRRAARIICYESPIRFFQSPALWPQQRIKARPNGPSSPALASHDRTGSESSIIRLNFPAYRCDLPPRRGVFLLYVKPRKSAGRGKSRNPCSEVKKKFNFLGTKGGRKSQRVSTTPSRRDPITMVKSPHLAASRRPIPTYYTTEAKVSPRRGGRGGGESIHLRRRRAQSRIEKIRYHRDSSAGKGLSALYESLRVEILSPPSLLLSPRVPAT